MNKVSEGQLTHSLIEQWLKNKALGIWEQIHNFNFISPEFEELEMRPDGIVFPVSQ